MMSKASELREMSSEQLGAELAASQKELFQLRIQASTEKLDAPSNIRRLRRQIARIKTIVHQRDLSAKQA
jgi:large subunit ribosomal protein L29